MEHCDLYQNTFGIMRSIREKKYRYQITLSCQNKDFISVIGIYFFPATCNIIPDINEDTSTICTVYFSI